MSRQRHKLRRRLSGDIPSPRDLFPAGLDDADGVYAAQAQENIRAARAREQEERQRTEGALLDARAALDAAQAEFEVRQEGVSQALGAGKMEELLGKLVPGGGGQDSQGVVVVEEEQARGEAAAEKRRKGAAMGTAAEPERPPPTPLPPQVNIDALEMSFPVVADLVRAFEALEVAKARMREAQGAMVMARELTQRAYERELEAAREMLFEGQAYAHFIKSQQETTSLAGPDLREMLEQMRRRRDALARDLAALDHRIIKVNRLVSAARPVKAVQTFPKMLVHDMAVMSAAFCPVPIAVDEDYEDGDDDDDEDDAAEDVHDRDNDNCGKRDRGRGAVPVAAQLATTCRDGCVRLFTIPADPQAKLPYDAPERTLRGHTAPVSTVCWSRDGRWLATGSSDKSVRIWDASSGACTAQLTGHHSPIYSVQFNTAGTKLATAGDTRIRIFNVADLLRSSVSAQQRAQQQIQQSAGLDVSHVSNRPAEVTLQGHTNVVAEVCYLKDPANVALASVSWDGSLRIWDSRAGTCVSSVTEHTAALYAVAVAPDGRRLASAGANGRIKIWDLTAPQHSVMTLQGHTADVCSLAYSADGYTLVSGGRDNTVKVWEVETGTCETSLEGLHLNGVNNVCASPFSPCFASSSRDHTVRLYRWSV